jgi:acetyl esterase/lipase
MQSIQSMLLKAFLRTVRLNKMWKITGDELRKSIEKKQQSESHEPPKGFTQKYDISKKEINEHCYYTVKPLGSAGQKHILYLHGGGYVYEISSLHWEFLGRLIDELNCTITVPIYPLTPRYQHQEVFDMIVPIYQQIISDVSLEDMVIMGDSAGGGIGLALGQLLKEKNLPQPGNIILISPVLDMSLSNPEIKAMEKYDPIAATPALLDIGRWYGGEKGTRYHLVSPLYGDIEGLGKVSLFIGTHEIMCPDSRRFKKMADERDIKIGYYEYPGMIHVWPLFFFPESKKATKQIIDIIMNSDKEDI